MSLDTEIDTLRTSVSGCSLVAFGDAGTRLMLRSSHEKTCNREYLDELCTQASNCFATLDAIPRSFGANSQKDMRLCEAIVLTSDQTRVFVRTQSDGADFLCCVCNSTCDTEGVAKAARHVLHKIVSSY